MDVTKDRIRFIVDIVDHCNLNCKGCGHFSPLAEHSFLDLDVFERDLKRLHELLHGEIHCLEIMGGEALLHPNVNDFIQIMSKYVYGEKFICTNGVLLPKMPDSFYRLCAETHTTISITIYPISLDWEEINRKANLYGTQLYKIVSEGGSQKRWYKNHRDLTGTQNPMQNFRDCFWRGRCVVLENGRLSSCVVPFKARFFQKYYKSKAFDTSEDNFIDIHKANSIEEIVEFLNQPIPCCRFCLPNTEEQIEWGVSNKQREEWY